MKPPLFHQETSGRRYAARSILSAALVSAAVAFTLATASCHRKSETSGDTLHLQPKEPPSAAKTTAAQNRVNEFFYAAVVPKLTTCWNKVEGKGEIEFKYTCRKVGRDWVSQKVEISRSTLSNEQNVAATQCMQSSVQGSSLPLEPEELAQNIESLVISWSWPAPLPADTSELARMIDTGGGGGRECSRICKDCAYDKDTHLSSCASSCVGWVQCQEDGTGTGCTMSGGKCISGWSGVWAPIFIARNEP